MRSLAAKHGAGSQTDEAGNAVVRVAASAGYEGAPTVAVQAHLDMVCEAEPGVAHDWRRDPIRPRHVEDAIYATGTTLGADNGIGVAAALSLLTLPDLRHGPLELVFTVDEERGLRGAMELDPALLSARFLINLDSEDHRKLFNGSAGTQDTTVRLPVRREPLQGAGWSGRRLVVSGGRGGHSGLEIQKRLANALKLLARSLASIRQAGVPVSLASLSGGTARNAIPRHAEADLALPEDSLAQFDQVVERIGRELGEEWGDAEPDLALEAEGLPTPGAVLAGESFESLLKLLARLPHGVLTTMAGEEGRVRASCNLAQAEVGDKEAELLLTSRSFFAADLERVQGELEGTASSSGATASLSSRYPPWTPDNSGSLLPLTTELYEKINGRPPQVETIHAGLECGVIASKVPGMEAISFGPSIRGAHTPHEHLVASTVMPMWTLLLKLLERLARG